MVFNGVPDGFRGLLPGGRLEGIIIPFTASSLLRYCAIALLVDLVIGSVDCVGGS